jgi:hypothetical protein
MNFGHFKNIITILKVTLQGVKFCDLAKKKNNVDNILCIIFYRPWWYNFHYIIIWLFYDLTFVLSEWGCRGHDRMVIGFITTYAISAYDHYSCEFESCSGEVYSIQHYVIKFVRDLWQVCSFLRVLQFPPPIKLTAMI